MRTNPHILEINTRAWLKRLEREQGRALTLAEIPQQRWQDLKNAGFDAVWLMGVWKQSPKAGEIARQHEEIRTAVAKAVPDYKPEDITASPYAVYEYQVDPALGGDDALKALRKALNDMGITLFLDFVGNHTAIDSPTVNSNPDLYINTGALEPWAHRDWFFKNDNGVYIAYGRDPYFAPWTDTAQLNYFNPDTKKFMLDNLLHVASLCDGVRCDMAMLSLNKVHRDTWWEFIGGALPKEEFWTSALEAVRERHPDFTFIAEVYWGLEWEIQQLGFDYTYDKVLYDRLRFSNPENIKAHLGAEHLYQMRSIRFTANHDEEESLKAFGREKSLAASTIIATLPGARMFHLFQLMGRPQRVPIQYTNDLFEEDAEVRAYYDKMLAVASQPAFHGGQWTLTDVGPVAGDPNSCRNVLAWTWKQMNTAKTVIINYSPDATQCHWQPRAASSPDNKLTEEFSGQELPLTYDVRQKGLDLALKAFESRIFTYAI